MTAPRAGRIPSHKDHAMKDLLDVRSNNDMHLLNTIASYARSMAQWPEGPNAAGFRYMDQRADFLLLELSFQIMLKATIAAGHAAAVAGKREEAEDIAAAIAIEAARRAESAMGWKTLPDLVG